MQSKEENEARERVAVNLAKIQSRVNRARENPDYVDDRAPHLRG